jgi:hypothetical protein
MFFRIVVLVLGLNIIFSIGCAPIAGEGDRITSAKSELPETPEPQPTKRAVPFEILNSSPTELCDRLSEIELLPYKDPNETDPIYEALVAKGAQAYPCLVEKITDKKRMPDPRQAPHWQHYAVGDTAVFILVRIIGGDDDLLQEKLLKEMLPPPYREEWKTNGIYAYFNYVSEPKNRKELQKWWKNWLNDYKK